MRLTIFDPTGQERFKSVPRSFYKRADGIILSYDMTTQSSFDNIMGWVADISEETNDYIPKILVATKSDLEEMRVVSPAKGLELAQTLKIRFFETSAKDDTNVTETFDSLIQDCQGSRSESISLSRKKVSKKKCC